MEESKSSRFAVGWPGLPPHVAEKARQSVIETLRGHLCSVHGSQAGASTGKPADQIKVLIQEIESLDTGAFAPLTRQPIFQAVLMPFGGSGILALLDYLGTVY